MCIGARFALIEATTALSKIIREYKIVPSELYNVSLVSITDHKIKSYGFLTTSILHFIVSAQPKSGSKVHFIESVHGDLCKTHSTNLRLHQAHPVHILV